MNQEPSDRLVLVDERDRPIGSATKEEAHSSPLLHRAFSVFLCDGDQMLLQMRARDKYHSGGLWANTCCSHPRAGETVLEAAGNRLFLEAGIHCALRPLFTFQYCHRFRENLYEHEFDHVFLGAYSGAYAPNPEEIEEMKWISFAKLKSQLSEEPQIFAPWFLIAAPKVMEIAAR